MTQYLITISINLHILSYTILSECISSSLVQFYSMIIIRGEKSYIYN